MQKCNTASTDVGAQAGLLTEYVAETQQASRGDLLCCTEETPLRSEPAAVGETQTVNDRVIAIITPNGTQ